VSFEKTAEQKIREAMAEGAFDDLPGRGTPLDLDEYFRTPEHLRMALSVLKSAGCVPEEVELLKQVADLERRLAEAPSGSRDGLQRELATAQLRLDLALERARRSR
jgi:hypothetical protein